MEMGGEIFENFQAVRSLQLASKEH